MRCRLVIFVSVATTIAVATLSAAEVDSRFSPSPDSRAADPQPPTSESPRSVAIDPKAPESAESEPTDKDAAANFLPQFIESAVGALRTAAKDKTSVQRSVARAEALAQINADLHSAQREFRFVIRDVQDAGLYQGKHWYMLKLAPVLGSEEMRQTRIGYANGINMPWIPKNRAEALAVKTGDIVVMTGNPELGPAEGADNRKYPTLLTLIPDRKNGRAQYALVVGTPKISIEQKGGRESN